MIGFARRHKAALWIVFGSTVSLVSALLVVNALWPERTEESWGWMLFFACVPWSIIAAAAPMPLGVLLLVAGAGVNAVLLATVLAYVFAWWLSTLRFTKP